MIITQVKDCLKTTNFATDRGKRTSYHGLFVCLKKFTCEKQKSQANRNFTMIRLAFIYDELFCEAKYFFRPA